MDTELLLTVLKIALYGSGTVLCLYVVLGIAHSFLIWLMGCGDD